MEFNSDFQFPSLDHHRNLGISLFLTLLFLVLCHSPFWALFSISSSIHTICHLPSFPLLQPWFQVWLPGVLPNKEPPEISWREAILQLFDIPCNNQREESVWSSKISQWNRRQEKDNNTIYNPDGLRSWIGSEGHFGNKPALSFTRKYPRIHKEIFSHWLGILPLSTTGRYRWPALI